MDRRTRSTAIDAACAVLKPYLAPANYNVDVIGGLVDNLAFIIEKPWLAAEAERERLAKLQEES